jgi:hypothetical protein
MTRSGYVDPNPGQRSSGSRRERSADPRSGEKAAKLRAMRLPDELLDSSTITPSAYAEREGTLR